MGWRVGVAWLVLQLFSAALAAPPVVVTWDVHGESLRTILRRSEDIAWVNAVLAGAPTRSTWVVGRVRRGQRENVGHRWHLTRTTLAQVTIEVCEGLPSGVDADLRYWLRLGRYCAAGTPLRVEPVRRSQYNRGHRPRHASGGRNHQNT